MAGLTCGGHCMKMMLFIFNAIFFLAGAAMLGIGIWMLVDPNIDEYFTYIAVGADDMFMAAAITITVIGALIFVIGFFGCCGAIKESQCMLCMFVALMSIVFALEIVVAILAGVFHKEISQGLEDEMVKAAVQDVYPIKENNNSAVSLAWHHMQYDLHCCGGNSSQNYKDNVHFAGTPTPVPKTCCVLKNDNPEKPDPRDYNECAEEFEKDAQDATELMNEGCYMALVDWMEKYAAILIGVAIGVALIQILGITFGCCVRNQLKRKSDYST